ncbi:hypothetical protein FB45DRAFT_885590 [Roridomyces roridus]|uniref:DUF6534 domain-containing protein n=1 Tax=Roridomyces roridus TaxID=1738132 RepID=A0AAD7CI14_9AGAR|nr:hypothetical protein FB45DRAFT_937727 [Roridomyces roridus]KAJ7649675.1 hypothetical protein FB45DRAFT_885590 [Roridomyces roridus]
MPGGTGDLNLTIGCLLFATWANLILFTIEAIQVYRYFDKYPRDMLFNKLSVVICVFADLLTVFSCLATSYLYMVTNWGSLEYLATQPYSIPMYIIGTAIGAAVVQVWLTRLVFNLTKQWFWLPIIALFILTGLVGGGATASQIFLDSSYTGRQALVRYVTIWLSGCSAADAFITAVIVWKFRTIKTSFASTQQLLHRLLISSVRNGSITTIMTVVTVIIFSIQPETNSATMIEMTIGRIYTISMLSNLNNRTLLGEAQGSSGAKKTHHGADTTATVLRIHQEVETHYQYDNDAIPMNDTQYGGKKSISKDVESGDGNSEVGVGGMPLPMVVSVKQETHYDNGF